MARAPRLPQGQGSFPDESARLILEVAAGAGYRALVRQAATGAVLASEDAPVAAGGDDVALYTALIAALRMAHALDPSAGLEVRMASRLVIEQMAEGRVVTHPDLQSLAAQARELCPPDVTWTWIPDRP